MRRQKVSTSRTSPPYKNSLTEYKKIGSEEEGYLYFDADGIPGISAAAVAAAHKTSHQNGGADEIDVTGLSGVLADPQTPASHTHTVGAITSLTAEKLLGRGAGGGSGVAQEITLGTNLSMTGTTLNVSVSAGSDHATLSNLDWVDTAHTGTPNSIASFDGTGDAVEITIGTTSGTLAAGDDSRIVGAAQQSSNLSDLDNIPTARTNLGLGDSATKNVGTSGSDVAAGDKGVNLTTKGDVQVYGTAPSRLPVGTNGQVLTADSAEALGVKWATTAGGGDVVGPSSSVDSEVALFDGTTGKLIKRAAISGIAKLTAGVLSAATAGTDYYAPGSTDVAVVDGGTGASNAADARANLGLGGAAVLSVGTTAGTIAAGDDSRITGAAQKASNLSDLASASTARTNLGLATVAATGAYSDLSGLPTLGTIAALSKTSTGDITGDWPAATVARVNGTTPTVYGLSLIDDADASAARTTLGLGGAAILNVGATAGTVAAGDDSRFTDSRAPSGAAGGDLSGTYPNPGVAKIGGVAVTVDPDGTLATNSDAKLPTQKAVKTYVDTGDALKLAKASNLSDLASASTARTNLGLGTAAVLAASTTPAASGLIQLDAVGFFGMAASLTDWRYSFGLATFSNGVTSVVGMANPSLAGTSGAGSTAAWSQRFSTANSGVFQGTRLLSRSIGWALAMTFKLPTSITSRRLWIGLGSTTMTDSDTAAGSFVGVRYSTVAGDAGFMPASRDGASQTIGSAGSAPVADVAYLLTMSCAVGGSAVAVKIVRLDTEATVLDVSISATLPASGTAIDWLIYCHGQGNSRAVEFGQVARVFGVT